MQKISEIFVVFVMSTMVITEMYLFLYMKLFLFHNVKNDCILKCVNYMHIKLKQITEAHKAPAFQSFILCVINNKRMYCCLSIIPIKGLNDILNHEGIVFCKSRFMFYWL